MEKTFIVFFTHKLFQEVERCIEFEVCKAYVHEKTLIKVHDHLLYPQGHKGVTKLHVILNMKDDFIL